MVNKEIMESSLVFNARKLLKMTTADAGQLLGVTRRTWEMWESGKVAMPFSKVELFLLKLQGKRLSEGSFIVVISPQQTPLAVVAQSNFCGIEHVGDDNYIIKSLMVDRVTGLPYVSRTRFNIDSNEHIIRYTDKWKSIVDD